MLVAGLAGRTPHMVSAAVASVSRVLFEYRDDIGEEVMGQIFEAGVVRVRATRNGKEY